MVFWEIRGGDRIVSNDDVVFYTKIVSSFWKRGMRKLSPEAKLLMLYFLTCPHRNLIGFYLLPLEYAQADTKLLGEGFAKGLGELFDKGSVLYDDENQLLLVKNFLTYNPIENPNQEKAAVKKLCELPDTPLMDVFLQELQELERVPVTLTQTVTERVTQTVTLGVTETRTKNKELRTKHEVKDKNIKAGGGMGGGASSVTPEEEAILDAIAPYSMTKKQLQSLLSVFSVDRADVLAAMSHPSAKNLKSPYLYLLNWFRRAGNAVQRPAPMSDYRKKISGIFDQLAGVWPNRDCLGEGRSVFLALFPEDERREIARSRVKAINAHAKAYLDRMEDRPDYVMRLAKWLKTTDFSLSPSVEQEGRYEETSDG